MSSALGPFDPRAQRRRCLRCIRGHLNVTLLPDKSLPWKTDPKILKCEGGFPCHSRIRTSWDCSPPELPNPMIRLDEAVNRGFQQKPRHDYLRVGGSKSVAFRLPFKTADFANSRSLFAS